MITIAERLEKLPPYLFVDLRQKMQAAQARGVDVISLGIGDPDIPTPDPVVETLCSAIQNSDDSSPSEHGINPCSTLPQVETLNRCLATCGGKRSMFQSKSWLPHCTHTEHQSQNRSALMAHASKQFLQL